MSEEKLIIVGVIVSPVTLSDLSIFYGFLVVENGKITQKGTKEEFFNIKDSEIYADYKVIQLSEGQFLLPGFVDCHTHAPQFPNIGLGLDRPLLEWLDNYTFPLESRYGDLEYANSVYNQVVRRLLNNGTTTACYFGSIHLEGTLELAKAIIEHKQRALVGKVSMNVKNDAGYYNETDKELKDVEDFINGVRVLASDNKLVEPIISPRFAISCDEVLMTGLAKLSAKYACGIQSHISENLEEINYVLKTNPSCSSYAEVYDRCNILNDKCIMAHAVHLTDEELSLFRAKGVSVAHCPASNTRLRSGLCPVRRLINSGITVGLGTDVSGGDSASILDAMRRAMDVSTHLNMQGGQDTPLDWKEVIYLATLGGAKALGLEDQIGSLEVGKDFDAILVDIYAAGGPIDRYTYPVGGILQRFVYLADDRNLVQIYVKGCKVKDIL